jgi:hypothetical protein
MKIRNGFVSNSSSSSFVCIICGESEVVYDGDSNGEWCYCAIGHTFCKEHLNEINKDTKKDYRQLVIDNAEEIIEAAIDGDIDFYQLIDADDYIANKPKATKLKLFNDVVEKMSNDELRDLYGNFDEESEDYFSVDDCPVCNLELIPDEVILSYVLDKLSISKKLINKEIKDKYKTLKIFNKEIK